MQNDKNVYPFKSGCIVKSWLFINLPTWLSSTPTEVPTLFLKWGIMRYWVEGKSGFAAIIEKLFKQIKSQSATISAPSIIEPLLAQTKCKPKFYFIVMSYDFNILNTFNRKVTASWWNAIHIKWNTIHIKMPELSSSCVSNYIFLGKFHCYSLWQSIDTSALPEEGLASSIQW